MNRRLIPGQAGSRLARPGLKTFLLAATVVAAGFVAVPQAFALPVTLTLQETGYANVTYSSATGDTGTPGGGIAFGTFSNVEASVNGSPTNPEPELLSNTINTSATTAGTLIVTATETGLTYPTGTNVGFLSSFTSNELAAGFTVTEATYINGNLLATTNFTKIGTIVDTNLVPSLTGPFTESEVFTINAIGAGATNDTIDLNAVPEPSSIAILGVGLIGMISVLGRRRRVSF